MEHVILIIHLIVTLALIVLILLQRSEGGGLVNASGGLGSFASARSTGNALTRMTAILATLFFITNLSLAIMARDHAGVGDVLEAVDAKQPTKPPVDGEAATPLTEPVTPAEKADAAAKSDEKAVEKDAGPNTETEAPSKAPLAD
jgi:preprotein translocase subunit SecG